MHQYVTFIGGFPIRFYGIFFSLGIIFGCIMAYYFLKKDGRGWHECMFDLGLTIAFVGIIGGRLWDVFFFDWDYYHNHLLEIPYVWQGGMAIQGGVLFACVAGYIYLKKHKIPVLQFADIIAPAIIFGQAIGRIANFMNGDAFGHPTGADFGLLYPSTPWPTTPTAPSPGGRQRYGNARATSSSWDCSCGTPASGTPEAPPSASTLCSTPSSASFWNTSAETTAPWPSASKAPSSPRSPDSQQLFWYLFTSPSGIEKTG